MTSKANGLSTQELEHKLNFLQSSLSSCSLAPFTASAPIHSLGVFSFDLTPYAELYSGANINRSLCCIVNTQPASLPGEHWVAFYRPARTFHIEFFDSYGQPPERYGFSVDLSSPQVSNIIFSNFPLQGYGSSVCGHYCLLFIFFRSKLDSLASAIKILASLGSNPSARDRKVQEIYTRIRIHKHATSVRPMPLMTNSYSAPLLKPISSSSDCPNPTSHLNLSQISTPNPIMLIN